MSIDTKVKCGYLFGIDFVHADMKRIIRIKREIIATSVDAIS
jgi:hypothetical protein